MISGEDDEMDDIHNAYPPIHAMAENNSPAQNQGRFSRYLKFARRRRHRQGESSEAGATRDVRSDQMDNSAAPIQTDHPM